MSRVAVAPKEAERDTGGDLDTGFSIDVAEVQACVEASGGAVPEFVNPKYTDGTKTAFKSPTRLECMMQEFPRLYSKVSQPVSQY